MTRQNFDINKLRVAAPCPMNWEQMNGDERKRFCSLCQLNVYNFSEMTTDEVQKLVAESEGRICGRLYKRADGTVLTKDCPVGFRAYQKRVARFAGATLGAILGLFSISYGQKEEKKSIDASEIKIARTAINSQASVLTGKITDEHGGVIPGVKVILIGKDGEKIAALTDGEGIYFFSSVAAGIYKLKIKPLTGLLEKEIRNFEIKENEKAELSINLKPDADAVTIGVLAYSPEEEIRLDNVNQLPAKKVIEPRKLDEQKDVRKKP